MRDVFPLRWIVWSSLDGRDWGEAGEVRTVCEDTHGRIWLGTDGGLVRYSRTEAQPDGPSVVVQTDREGDQDPAQVPPVIKGTQLTFKFNAIDSKTRADSRRFRYQIVRSSRSDEGFRFDSEASIVGKEASFRWPADTLGAFTLAVSDMTGT